MERLCPSANLLEYLGPRANLNMDFNFDDLDSSNAHVGDEWHYVERLGPNQRVWIRNLNGPIAAALMANADRLLAVPPTAQRGVCRFAGVLRREPPRRASQRGSKARRRGRRQA